MKILLIEDDEVLCDTLRLSLDKAGYDTEICHSGTDGLLFACSSAYDCLIIDRMLPEMDGLTLLQALRRRGIQTPAIFSTALDGLNDRVNGLDAGADDYIAKPYAVEELLARIRAVTRRPGRIEDDRALIFEGLMFLKEQRELRYQNSSVTLSKKEASLVEYFFRNPGRTLNREMILTYVWGSSSEVEEGNLDNYIYFIRRRLSTLKVPVRIVTVHGVGYRLEKA
ncbi:response regulator transcription factor [uncultured Clostridium sp.]|uniref:response regulator transcription factor n=1 Tax=uncultured Clostridium sp. TaxID=59620 RepID=UPI0025FDBD58|nr:response regulator transcription factor [uncultured Clostridium sp.]